MKDRTIVRWLHHGVEIEEEIVFGESDDSESSEVEWFEPITGEQVTVDVNETENHMIQICLHDCLEKLGILKCINQKDAPPKKNQFPVYKTLEERFGQTINYELENISEDAKRYDDISTIYSILYKTMQDLNNYRHYKSLIEGTAILKRLAKEEEELLANEEKSTQMVQELRVKLDTQSKILDNKYKEKLEELRKLELEYEDAIGYGNLEIKYIESWETARRYQGQLVLNGLENGFLDTVNLCELKTYQENKVHTDIVNYIEENSQDMQNEIQYWMDRFEVELETREAQLLKLRIEKDSQMEKFMDLKESFEERKQFIEHWEKIIHRRKIEAEHLVTQTRAAIKLQAWWRGIMYRRKLGPYGKGKKKKVKGKGKDKDKGKDKGKGAKKGKI